jgi:pSer/pThr/pTyr-binding forkhead associated (FHA) protein
MKVLKIGRDEDCDIRISDEENRISRVHAFLRIYPFGSIEIIDNSKNGTKVGGNPISYGQPYPVKRNETVNFADVRRLDWSLVPNPLKRIMTIAGLLVTVAIIIGAIVFALHLRGSSDVDNDFDTHFANSEQPSQQSTITQPTITSKPANSNGKGNTQRNDILIDEDGHRVYEGIFVGSKDDEKTGGNSKRTIHKQEKGKGDSKDNNKKDDKSKEKEKTRGTDKNEDSTDGINEIL